MYAVVPDLETGSPTMIPVQYSLPLFNVGDCVTIEGNRTLTIANITIEISSINGVVVTDIGYKSFGGVVFKQDQVDKLIRRKSEA